MASKGYWRRGWRAKEGAFETIDNITKFALTDDDYEDFEEWVDYTPEEVARMEEANAKAVEVSNDEILEAIAELGALVANK